MSTSSSPDVVGYLKTKAMFLGNTFLETLVGGIVGSVVSGVVGFLGIVPLVDTTFLVSLPALGATLGFFVPFVEKLFVKK